MNLFPLISADDLARALVAPHNSVKLVDASFVLPGTTPTALESFRGKRIGEAVFFDIDAIADKATDLPHMLPDAAAFARAVEDLSLSNTDDIVVYGQSGIVMGPARVWWTFRVFGHDRVRVLDGGLPAWIAHGGSVRTDPPTTSLPEAKGRFTARFRPDLVANQAQVARACADPASVVLDARSAERFEGTVPEPRPGLHSGHIPGSLNMPCMDLVDAQTGRMKPPEELRRMFEARGVDVGVDKGREVIATCGSGVTACAIALALAVLGRMDVKVYDGSWADWGRGACPVACGKD